MAILNIDKPTTSIANILKVSFGITWAADLNTWAAELQTWDETISIFDGFAKPSTSITNQAKP